MIHFSLEYLNQYISYFSMGDKNSKKIEENKSAACNYRFSEKGYNIVSHNDSMPVKEPLVKEPRNEEAPPKEEPKKEE